MKPSLFLILLLCTPLLFSQETHQDGFLPKWLTEEEKLRLHEIDHDREATDPPAQPSRNIAEFEPMSGALIRYPLGIPYSLIALMSEEVEVVTIVADHDLKQQAINNYQNHGVNMDNCSFIIAPTNSIWTRDYGPWYIFDGNNEFGIMDFEYDRPRPHDNAIPGIFAELNDVNYFHMGLVHTGGDYMSDGMGAAASTLAAYAVNSGYTPAQVDSIMHLFLGIENYHVVPNIHGGLSHIDTWAKFLAPDKIMIREVAPDHPYYHHAELAVEYFGSQISSYGTPYKVYRVYTPNNEPYTNSLILNNRVYVPQNGSAWDDDAVEAFEEAMPGYEVFGIPYGGWSSNDALHCRVREIPDTEMLYIDHQPVFEDQQAHHDYEIRARIIPMSGQPVYDDSLRVYYRANDQDFTYELMTHDENHWYTAYIPQQDAGTQISYYIKAADASGRSEHHPYIGHYDPHMFNVVGPLVFQGAQISDAAYGNNNGFFDTGETVEILASYNNKGIAAINNLQAQLSTGSQYVTVHPPGQAVHSTLNPGEETVFSFIASASLTCPDNYIAEFELTVTADDGIGSNEAFSTEVYASAVQEYFIQEGFDQWLPEGWETTSTSGQINWQQSNTNYAGGIAPEARFYYNPSNVAIQRLITPSVDKGEYSQISLEFKHLINDYQGGYALRVETSSDGGNSWTEILSYPDANMPSAVETILIDNEDVGSDDFRIAWTFDGDSWDINWWSIDDVMVGGVNIHDDIAFFAGQVTLDGGPGTPENVLISAGDQHTTPDDTGFFVLAVNEGMHDVTAALQGYIPGTLEDAWVQTGDTLYVDFLLEYLSLPGDANCDGIVDVLDVITIVSYFLGLEPEPFCFDSADVNGDGVINVLDVIGTVDIFLNRRF